jgi:mono/diheme cytochrome c family protein
MQWYEMVTVGNLERLMPGFASLTDAQRWDVTAYALSLSSSPEALIDGESNYAKTCLECHAADGGDMPILLRSADQIFTSISDGKVHAFAVELSTEQVWETVAYVQTLPFQRSDLAEEDVEVVITGTIHGQLRNGTPGSSIPTDLDLILIGVEGDAEVMSQTVEIAQDGSYLIQDLEIVPGRLFFLNATYQGVIYQSDVAHFLVEEPDLALPLTIFESMSSREPIRVDRLHVLFDFSAPDTLRVIQLLVLSNLSDRVLIPDSAEPLLEIPLPQEAFNLTFEEGSLGDRYSLTSTGFGDLAPLMPGSGNTQLVFSYDLPYQSGLEIQAKFDYPVGAVVLLMPDGGPRLRGEGIEDLGLRDMGGISMQNYETSSIPAGRALSYELTGRHPFDQTSSAPSELVLGAGLLLLVGAGTAYVWVSGQRKRDAIAHSAAPPEQSRQDLIHAIARLDIDHDRERIKTEEYELRREELKSRLKDHD